MCTGYRKQSSHSYSAASVEVMDSKLRILLVAGALSASGCEYFSDVTIPSTDNTAPLTYAGVWRSGNYLATSLNSNPALNFQVSSLDDYYIFFGAGIDSGGTRRITISREVQRLCVNGSIAQQQTFTLTPIVRTQSGSPGNTVSNGIWDGPYMRLRDYASCNPGYTLSSVSYIWHTTSEDFAGNQTSHGWARARWSS